MMDFYSNPKILTKAGSGTGTGTTGPEFSGTGVNQVMMMICVDIKTFI